MIMSLIGEALLKALVLLKQQQSRRVLDSRGDTYEDYFRWQYESSPKLFAKYEGLDLAGKSVLEIGCGIGGRTAWLAAQGTTRAVGIDINAGEIASAAQLCAKLYPSLTPRVEYLRSEEDKPLELGQFDYVLLVDSMEHVVSPLSILRLAYQYTKPGGSCYFGTIGWYHHVASHTGLFPFATVFFSDETILNVMRWHVSRPNYKPSRFDSVPPVERWRGIYDLRDRPNEHLNKITIRQMKRLMRYNIFGGAEMHVFGFGSRALRPFRPMSRVPLLQEMFHSYFVVRLEKAERSVRDPLQG
jgi:2-polyprenyl-3-methyl-5-hydroxy-6-metoxy-1,4-benzoquinol methylase